MEIVSRANLFNPRHIRLVRGIITCPACARKCFKNFLQYGRAFQTCEHSRCDTEWLSIALPPDCFGGYLAATMGAHQAEAIIRRCWPHLGTVEPPTLWTTNLIDGDEPAWIQMAVRPRERHLYRQATVTELLTHLLRPAA